MLELKELSVELGAQEFIYSLVVEPREIVVILGPSGSGKSTLLNLIAGFLSPHSGDVSWCGQSLLHFTPDQRPVTTLFQKHNLFAHLSVWKNVALGLRTSTKLNSIQSRQLSEALAQVGLQGFEQRIPTDLSGGEQQRVALARCLLSKKPVLLLDEPYSALDAELRSGMLALTRRIVSDSQLATILVTHDPNDADALGARVARLHRGRLVLER